jgi:hypothetical protein
VVIEAVIEDIGLKQQLMTLAPLYNALCPPPLPNTTTTAAFRYC